MHFMNRKSLKNCAKDVLKKYYKQALLAIVIVSILSLNFISINSETVVNYETYTTDTYYYLSIFNFDIQLVAVGFIIVATIARLVYDYVIVSPLTYGLKNHLKYLSMDRGDEFDIFEGLRHHHKDIIILHIMRDIRIILWLFLFIIPGIIKLIEYQYVDEIFEEHPDWTYKEVLAESSRLTYGLKWELFVLDLSFFLWYLLFGLLDIFTLGLASYLLDPYVRMTNVQAYFWLKEIKNPQKEETFEVIQNQNTFENYSE